jgi:hypothetical protein
MTFARQLKNTGSCKWAFRKLVNLNRRSFLKKLIVGVIETEISSTEPDQFTQNPLILPLVDVSLNNILPSTLNSQVAASIQVFRLKFIWISHIFCASCMQHPYVPPCLGHRKQVWGSPWDIRTTDTSITVATSRSLTRNYRIRVLSFTGGKSHRLSFWQFIHL